MVENTKENGIFIYNGQPNKRANVDNSAHTAGLEQACSTILSQSNNTHILLKGRPGTFCKVSFAVNVFTLIKFVTQLFRDPCMI